MNYKLAAWIGLAVISTQALAGSSLKTWGPSAGVYLPQSSELKQVFGDSWFSIGISPTKTQDKSNWVFGTDVGLTTVEKNGSRLLMIPASFGFSKSFRQEGQDWAPFLAARAGVVYLDYAITRPSNSVRYVANELGTNTNVEVGFTYRDAFRISARYDWFSTSNRFRFDGMTIKASLTLVRF